MKLELQTGTAANRKLFMAYERFIKLISSLSKKIEKRHFLASFFVFLFFLGINCLIYLTVSAVSSIDDQWFHFKFAYLFRTEGWEAVTNFKWLYFTNLAQDNLNYGVTLYHYFLIPFTFFHDKIFGLKLAGTIMASIVPAMFFYVLKKFDIKKSLLWVLFFYAFASFNVIWRLYINRNFVLIDGLILLEILFIFKRKYWALFIVAILHTWWHPGTFWIAPVMSIAFEAIRYANIQKAFYKNMIAGVVGSMTGFLFFPPHADHLFAPMNPIGWLKSTLPFFYKINSGVILREGNEGYKKDFLTFISNNYFIFFALTFIIVLNIIIYIYKKKNDNRDLDDNADRAILREFLFLLSILLFFGLIVASTRFEDILFPCVFLSVILIVQFFQEKNFIQLNNFMIKRAFVISAIIAMSYLFVSRGLDVRNSISKGQDYGKYEEAGDWLKANTKKDEIIFNTEWGQFPRLFFFNDYNRYIVGIEPMSLYRYNPELYWLWNNISYNGVACSSQSDCSNEQNQKLNGKAGEELDKILIAESSEIKTAIRDRFQSKYVFFDNDTLLRKEMDKNTQDYELAYFDKEESIFIYRLK